MLSVVARTAGASLEKPLEIVRGNGTRMPWAWDGLCFAVPFNEPNFEGSRDIVNNVTPTVFTGVSWGRDNRGNIVAILPLAAYIDYANHPRHDLPATAITVYVRVKRVGAGNGWGALASNIYAVGPPYTSWLIGDDVSALGKLNGQLAISGSAFITTPDATAIGTTEYVSAFLRWSGTTLRLDVLGERGNTLSSVTGADSNAGPVAYAANKGIRINGNEGEPPGTFNGRYSQVMMWKRRLTDVEMSSLVSDPFGWYSPRRETVTVAAPFPVGPGMAAQGMQFVGGR